MIEIRPLQPEDDRQSFVSGNAELDRFFRKFAAQNQFRLHIGTTYVAVTGREVLGFITLAATSLVVDRLPARARRRLPQYPLPALRVARLAVAQSAQGQGLGKRLLRVAFQLAHEMAERIGCIGVVVDAKSDAVAFYERLGFERLEVVTGCLQDHPPPLPMFVPLDSVPREVRKRDA
jgi:GNAT superfamily N-acetyltransferase